MVVFNELRLSDDKKKLIVDCFIENLNIYTNMYIKEIAVDYYKNVETGGDPSENAITIYSNTGDDTSVKAASVCLNMDNQSQKNEVAEKFGISNLKGGVYYVFVMCDGTPEPAVATLPCGYDEDTEVGIVPDWELLYEIGLKYIINMAGSCIDKCVDNSPFMHFILMWNSLKMALSACEYNVVEKVWDMILRTYRRVGSTLVENSCGCN